MKPVGDVIKGISFYSDDTYRQLMDGVRKYESALNDAQMLSQESALNDAQMLSQESALNDAQMLSQASLWDFANEEGIDTGFWSGVGYHSPLLTSLSFPRKRLPPGEKVERRNGSQFMVITPGERLVDGQIERLEAPWGIVPRKLLPWIVSTVRSQWEDGLGDDAALVRLGTSRSDMLRRLGLGRGGNNLANLLHQLEVLTRSRIVIMDERKTSDGREETQIDVSMSVQSTVQRFERSQRGWDMTLEVGPMFFRSIVSSVVPIDMRAVHRWSIASNRAEANCWTVDVGIWLAHRLKKLNDSNKRSQFISVDQLRQQFGVGHKRNDRYMDTIRWALNRIVDTYSWPDLVVPSIDNRGITLYPSKLLVSSKGRKP